jgi:hypothetical protein
MSKTNNNLEKNSHKEEITRKEAIKKAGKYAAVTTASMLIVLSPKKSQAQSPTPTPGW